MSLKRPAASRIDTAVEDDTVDHELKVLDTDDRRHEALATLEDYIPKRHHGGEALSATNISLAFGGLTALEDVSITVPTCHFVGLLGPNGAGKSTLFDVLNGLKRADSGQVHLFGRDVTRTRPWDRARLGMARTFQANRVNPSLSVKENLLGSAQQMIGGGLVPTMLGFPGVRRAERGAEDAARALTYLLDIGRYWNQRVGDLDFGAQRRVELGRTIMSGPRLLLLDEPAAGLDARETAILFALVRRLQVDLGLTVLLVEHYVKAVLENADLVYVLNRGRLIAAGAPDDIAANPDVQAEYLGSMDVSIKKGGPSCA